MNATEAVLSQKLGKPGLLYVGGALWGKRVTNCTLGKSSCGIRLKPTWQAEWAALLPSILISSSDRTLRGTEAQVRPRVSKAPGGMSSH